ncbi:MAG: hypothetical protein K9G39_00685 [Chlorobium sp.]|uniref:hypothetical protein n=1 Tax=Chlorobium sp. TaxID=1095 RepID=UPI0025BAC80D|nr:hypothetical protein [Chlorobium sp.]MCF8382101.1 hypothetical protein [Chlorobium sp.]
MNIHWGVIKVLQDAAESFIEKEQGKARFHREQQLCCGAMTDEGLKHDRIVKEGYRRITEVETFREKLSDVATTEDIDSLLSDRVRGWLILGMASKADASRWTKELVDSGEWSLKKGLMPYEQYFMFQAHNLLRRLPADLSEPVDQAHSLNAESRCLQFIEERHKLAAPDDQLLYLPLKGGRRPVGAKTKTGYIAKLYDDFKKESPVLVALSVFEQAFKTYKRQLNEKKNR